MRYGRRLPPSQPASTAFRSLREWWRWAVRPPPAQTLSVIIPPFRQTQLALLPINGREPPRGVAGNFTAEEAAQLGKEIDAEQVIPCHYEMFEFNTVSPEGFVITAQQIGQKYRLLKCGERLDL